MLLVSALELKWQKILFDLYTPNMNATEFCKVGQAVDGYLITSRKHVVNSCGDSFDPPRSISSLYCFYQLTVVRKLLSNRKNSIK